MFHVKHFQTYRDLLTQWQERVKLVAPSTLADAETRHFADSAQLADHVPQSATIADLGSGAGFPGLVLALLRPDLTVHLIESDGRKAAFLKHVSRETSAGATVHIARLESLYNAITPDIITARALAPLNALCGMILPWAQENLGLQALFLKGAKAEEEISAARQAYDFAVDIFPSATATDGRILRLTKLCAKADSA